MKSSGVSLLIGDRQITDPQIEKSCEWIKTARDWEKEFLSSLNPVQRLAWKFKIRSWIRGVCWISEWENFKLTHKDSWDFSKYFIATLYNSQLEGGLLYDSFKNYLYLRFYFPHLEKCRTTAIHESKTQTCILRLNTCVDLDERITNSKRLFDGLVRTFVYDLYMLYFWENSLSVSDKTQ